MRVSGIINRFKDGSWQTGPRMDEMGSDTPSAMGE